MTYSKLHVPVKPEQSAVIPFRVEAGTIEVLLVTTRNKGKWIIPKGGLEDGLKPHQSAELEALEEAGVTGNVSSISIGCYRHGTSDDDPIVEVFLMRVDHELELWPEHSERTRQWVSLEEAYHHVEDEGLKSILDEAATIMRTEFFEAESASSSGVHPALPQDAFTAKLD